MFLHVLFLCHFLHRKANTFAQLSFLEVMAGLRMFGISLQPFLPWTSPASHVGPWRPCSLSSKSTTHLVFGVCVELLAGVFSHSPRGWACCMTRNHSFHSERRQWQAVQTTLLLLNIAQRSCQSKKSEFGSMYWRQHNGHTSNCSCISFQRKISAERRKRHLGQVANSRPQQLQYLEGCSVTYYFAGNQKNIFQTSCQHSAEMLTQTFLPGSNGARLIPFGSAAPAKVNLDRKQREEACFGKH